MWWALPATAATSEVVSIRYDVVVDGIVVGTRDLQVTWFDEGDAPSRLLECRTSATIVGHPFEQHSSGLGSRRVEGFASTLRDPDGSWEVQATRTPEGLHVQTVTERGTQRDDLVGIEHTTLSLMDPGVRLGEGPTRILSAETGEVTSGTWSRDGDAWVLTTSTGTHTLEYGEGGYLLRWQTSWLGQEVELRADPPPARTWGGLDALPDRRVQEESL